MNDFEVVNIDTGDILTVRFESLPDIEVEGRVLSINPNEGGEDKNFSVLIGLETIPEGVRWGMTATVIIQQE